MTGVENIARERERQIKVEGWTAEHDDLHSDGQLAEAAACYAAPQIGVEDWWPWQAGWWKPSPDKSTAGRIKELAKAGALIAAEIDRLQRVALPEA